MWYEILIEPMPMHSRAHESCMCMLLAGRRRAADALADAAARQPAVPPAGPSPAAAAAAAAGQRLRGARGAILRGPRLWVVTYSHTCLFAYWFAYLLTYSLLTLLPTCSLAPTDLGPRLRVGLGRAPAGDGASGAAGATSSHRCSSGACEASIHMRMVLMRVVHMRTLHMRMIHMHMIHMRMLMHRHMRMHRHRHRCCPAAASGRTCGGRQATRLHGHQRRGHPLPREQARVGAVCS